MNTKDLLRMRMGYPGLNPQAPVKSLDRNKLIGKTRAEVERLEARIQRLYDREEDPAGREMLNIAILGTSAILESLATSELMDALSDEEFQLFIAGLRGQILRANFQLGWQP